MFRYRSLGAAALALGIYGVLGILVTAALVVIGQRTFAQVEGLQATLDTQRVALAQFIRTASRTIAESSATATDVQRSVEAAQVSANTASHLSFTTSITFRELARQLQLQIFGIQPFVGLEPQFTQSADQLEQLAISLGTTRDVLGLTRDGVGRVGSTLGQLQRQLEGVATTVEQTGGPGTSSQQMLPFQLAFYGMCLLVALQSVFSIIAGVALFRLARALGNDALFPHVVRIPPSAVPGTAASRSVGEAR